MPAPNYSAADWLQAHQALMPRGLAWNREPDSTQTKVLTGLTQIYARTTARANYLLIDAFPATTNELLPEWEATLGLPDPCAGEGATIQQRVAQVVARLRAAGGQSMPYFVRIAATLGYDIAITLYAPSRMGKAFGTPFGGPAWAHTWMVNAPTFEISYAQFGRSFGTRFVTWANNVLQCEFMRLKPAHTTLLFSY